MKRLEPNPENHCFGCGGANSAGMKLTFVQDDEQKKITGRFRVGEDFQGGTGFLHGGIIATLLDEAMGKVSRLHEVTAVTAELKVQYLRPIRVNQEIIVEGFPVDRDGKQLYYKGEIRNTEGVVLAKGEGRFVVVDRERYTTKLANQKA
ncbi:MAG: PaaI family thioesterase [Acidobacteria bacterium]|nr:PaaI family thioesterase [Acidobacteriota bacterium]